MYGNATLAMLVSSTSMKAASATTTAITQGLALGRHVPPVAVSDVSVMTRPLCWRLASRETGQTVCQIDSPKKRLVPVPAVRRATHLRTPGPPPPPPLQIACHPAPASGTSQKTSPSGALVRGQGSDHLTEVVEWLCEAGEGRIALHTAGVSAVDVDGLVAALLGGRPPPAGPPPGLSLRATRRPRSVMTALAHG